MMERLTTNLETDLSKIKVMCSAVVEGEKVVELGLFVITLAKKNIDVLKAEWDHAKAR